MTLLAFPVQLGLFAIAFIVRTPSDGFQVLFQEALSYMHVKDFAASQQCCPKFAGKHLLQPSLCLGQPLKRYFPDTGPRRIVVTTCAQVLRWKAAGSQVLLPCFMKVLVNVPQFYPCFKLACGWGFRPMG